MKMITRYLVLVVVALLATSHGFTAGSRSIPVLGQVICSEMTMDGVSVPPGTTLLNETRLQTGSFPAAIHLVNGSVLELAENSSAYFERGTVKFLTRDYRGAIGDLERALEINPDHKSAKEMLSLTRKKLR